MPRVVISAEAYNIVRRCADDGLDGDTGQNLGNGNYAVELGRDTIGRALLAMLPDETLSDTIIRVASLYLSNGRMN